MEKATRILFVTADLRTGGAERHVVTTLPALEPSRFASSVCCINARGELFDEIVAAGIPAISLDVRDMGRAPGRAVWRLALEMRRTRPDVVMAQGFGAGICARIAARAVRVPVMIVWKHNVGNVGLHGLTERFGEAIFGNWTTRYFCVSYAQVNYLVHSVKLDPAKIRVVYNAIAPNKYVVPVNERRAIMASLDVSEQNFVIAMVAVLRREKDHHTMLRAFSMLVQDVPEAILLIAGDGPIRAELESLAEKLGVGDRVRFLGDRRDVSNVLAIADVAALSSYTVENFPYSILEAMAMEKPSVCTAIGGLPEMIEDGVTGFLVPAREPKAMAERLRLLAQRDGLRRAMGAAAHERLERRFALGPSALHLASLIESALRDQQPARERRSRRTISL
jgi:glycosyltransferase involved in cell wall biosynthesis